MIKSLVPSAVAAFVLLSTSAYAEPTSAQSNPLGSPASVVQAREAFTHYLSAWVGRHAAKENLDEIFTHDAVVELNVPARPDWHLHIDGRTAIGRFMQEGIAAGTSWSFGKLHLFPTQRPDVVFAQYDSTAVIQGLPTTQTNLVVIELDGAKISHLRDLNGSAAVIAALVGSPRLAAHRTGDAPGQ